MYTNLSKTKHCTKHFLKSVVHIHAPHTHTHTHTHTHAYTHKHTHTQAELQGEVEKEDYIHTQQINDDIHDLVSSEIDALVTQ